MTFGKQILIAGGVGIVLGLIAFANDPDGSKQAAREAAAKEAANTCHDTAENCALYQREAEDYNKRMGLRYACAKAGVDPDRCASGSVLP